MTLCILAGLAVIYIIDTIGGVWISPRPRRKATR